LAPVVPVGAAVTVTMAPVATELGPPPTLPAGGGGGIVTPTAAGWPGTFGSARGAVLTAREAVAAAEAEAAAGSGGGGGSSSGSGMRRVDQSPMRLPAV